MDCHCSDHRRTVHCATIAAQICKCSVVALKTAVDLLVTKFAFNGGSFLIVLQLTHKRVSYRINLTMPPSLINSSICGYICMARGREMTTVHPSLSRVVSDFWRVILLHIY